MKLPYLMLGLGLAVAVAFSAHVRTVPSVAAEWHVDPRAVDQVPDQGRYLLRGTGEDPQADGPAPIWPGSPDAVLGRFDTVAQGERQVRVVGGSVDEGVITYVARTPVWGFPDYVSVAADAVPGGTALTIYSRVRFGHYDLGVNARRVKRWLRGMETAAP